MFGELFACIVANERHVQVARRGNTQGLLQQNLTGGVAKQIRATNDLRYALVGIIDYHGELIGVQTVATSHDKITHLTRNVLLDQSKGAIYKKNGISSCDSKSERRMRLINRYVQRGAGAGIDQIAFTISRRVSKHFSRAATGVDVTIFNQLRHRSVVSRGALALAQYIAVGPKTVRVELLMNQVLGIWRAAWRINVFDSE